MDGPIEIQILEGKVFRLSSLNQRHTLQRRLSFSVGQGLFQILVAHNWAHFENRLPFHLCKKCAHFEIKTVGTFVQKMCSRTFDSELPAQQILFKPRTLNENLFSFIK